MEQSDTKVDRKNWAKAAKALQENEVYKIINDRIGDLRNEAHAHVLMLSQEDIGRHWRERMHAFDEVLGIIDDIVAESKDAERIDAQK